ncbi:hypothetical protein ACHQM5_003137 [Ranunculus cassubicifolius]
MKSGTSKRKKSRKITKKVVKEKRNWLELPRDILIHIFIKLGTVDVLYTAQRVCSLWRKISKEPQIFRSVDMRNHWHVFGGHDYHEPYAKMTTEALNRSCGELVEFSMEYFAKSNSSLKCLRLANSYDISEEAFIKIAEANPMLEEIDLPLCQFGAETIGVVGRSCQQLKSFRMTGQGVKREESYYQDSDYDWNEKAYAVANNMPGLCRLSVLGDSMDNNGLQAILDKCPHLEYLDLRRCFRIDLKGDILKKCVDKIREIRLPDDPTTDYEFQVGDDDGYTSDNYESDYW